MKNKNNIEQLLFIIIFLLMLIVPNVVLIFNLETNKNNENRKFHSLQDFNPKDPIASLFQYKNYYSENFGLKTTLVNNYIDFKFRVLNETPMSNKVVKGKDGWYFLGNSYNNTLDNAFGHNHFSRNELKEMSSRIWEIKSYLHEKNIAFYIVIPPNKNSIYKEYLPYQLDEEESSLSVLKNYLRAEINFEIIDLTESLLIEKNKNRLYYKTDSHWNDYGAFIGYKETIKHLNQDFTIPSVSLTDYNVDIKSADQGDIIKMINLEIEESVLTLTKKISSDSTLSNVSGEHNQMINQNNNLKLFLCHDSFSYAWMLYFNETFDDIKYLKNYKISKKQIEQEKPDIVIFEIVERNISKLLSPKGLLFN